MKYTRDDIIIWADDERLPELVDGNVFESTPTVYQFDSPYQAFKAIRENANNLNESSYAYECKLVGLNKNRSKGDVSTPFVCMDEENQFINTECIVLKKEPEKKIVPFDFSLKEDRDALMGKRIISTSGDLIVTAFAFWSDWGWLLQIDSEFGYDSDYVLGEFVFADTGKPVGKEVTE